MPVLILWWLWNSNHCSFYVMGHSSLIITVLYFKAARISFIIDLLCSKILPMEDGSCLFLINRRTAPFCFWLCPFYKNHVALYLQLSWFVLWIGLLYYVPSSSAFAFVVETLLIPCYALLSWHSIVWTLLSNLHIHHGGWSHQQGHWKYYAFLCSK